MDYHEYLIAEAALETLRVTKYGSFYTWNETENQAWFSALGRLNKADSNDTSMTVADYYRMVSLAELMFPDLL